MQPNTRTGPHQGQPIRFAGEPLERAKAAAIMVHGRGAAAEDILKLANALDVTGVAFVAPQANGNAWYPERFLAPLEMNEPWLSSALTRIEEMLARVAAAGIPPEHTLLLGFSQGACLTLEFVARHARRYGGVVGLSGALIGPDGTPRNYAGSLENTPVFMGCSETDFHVAKERVLEAADVLRGLGGRVTARLYPNMEHEVNPDEIDFVRGLLSQITQINTD